MSNELPLQHRLLQGIGDLPKNDDDEFWATINNSGFKACANLLLIDVAIKSDPASLNDDQCRSQLAKIYAYAQLLRSPEGLKKALIDNTPIPQPKI